jgi:hypothetical protein
MIQFFMENPLIVLFAAVFIVTGFASLLAWLIVAIEDYLREKRIQKICEEYRIKREKDEKEHQEFMRQYSFDALSKKLGQ